MVRFFCIMLSMALVLTLFLFPRSELGELMDSVTGEKFATTRIVTLSPAFGYGSRKELFKFILSPRISDFLSSQHQEVMLVKPNVILSDDGAVISDWSFSWLHWFLVILLPSAIIAAIISWKLKHSALLRLKRLNGVSQTGPNLD